MITVVTFRRIVRVTACISLWAAVALAAVAAAALHVGCSAGGRERNAAIPDVAVLKVQGSGDAVTYTPEVRGTVYVYDATDDEVLWAGDVRDHAEVTVSPKEDAVRADGRIVRQKGTHYGHQYRIFFQPAL
jgi:hypothetical protein